MSEFYGQKGNHFYGIVSVEETTETVWGIIGGKINRHVKNHGTEEESDAYFQEKSNHKIESGYKETTHHQPDIYSIASIEFCDSDVSETESLDGILETLEQQCTGCCDAGCPACVLRDQILESSSSFTPPSLPSPSPPPSPPSPSSPTPKEICPGCEKNESMGDNLLCRKCDRVYYYQWDDEFSHQSAVCIQKFWRRILAADQLLKLRSNYRHYIPGLEIAPSKSSTLEEKSITDYNLIPGNPYLSLFNALLHAVCDNIRINRSNPIISFERFQTLLFDIVPRDSIPQHFLPQVDTFLEMASHGSVRIKQECQRLVDMHLSDGGKLIRFELFHSGMSNPAIELLTSRVWDYLEKKHTGEDDSTLLPLHPFNRIIAT